MFSFTPLALLCLSIAVTALDQHPLEDKYRGSTSTSTSTYYTTTTINPKCHGSTSTLTCTYYATTAIDPEYHGSTITGYKSTTTISPLATPTATGTHAAIFCEGFNIKTYLPLCCLIAATKFGLYNNRRIPRLYGASLIVLSNILLGKFLKWFYNYSSPVSVIIPILNSSMVCLEIQDERPRVYYWIPLLGSFRNLAMMAYGGIFWVLSWFSQRTGYLPRFKEPITTFLLPSFLPWLWDNVEVLALINALIVLVYDHQSHVRDLERCSDDASHRALDEAVEKKESELVIGSRETGVETESIGDEKDQVLR